MYRVKLYGCTGQERDAFASFLAATLKIDPDTAEELLRSSPVVIAETGDHSRAERLKSLIESRQGLCLVESDGGEADEIEEIRPAVTSSEDRGPELQRESDAKVSGPFVRPALLAGIAALVSVGLLWLFSGSSKIDGRGIPASISEQTVERTGEQRASHVDAGLLIDDLEDEVRRLEKKAVDLNVRVRWHQEDLMKLYNSQLPDYQSIRHKKLLLRTAQVELTSVRKALREKRDRLASVSRVTGER